MSAERSYVAICVGSLVYLALYVAPLAGLVPELWYLPLENRWLLGHKPPVLAMDWFGRTLFAVLGGLIGGGLTAALTRRTERVRGSAVWATVLALALAGGMAAYVSVLYDRVPKPEPLPPGYVPR